MQRKKELTSEKLYNYFVEELKLVPHEITPSKTTQYLQLYEIEFTLGEYQFLGILKKNEYWSAFTLFEIASGTKNEMKQQVVSFSSYQYRLAGESSTEVFIHDLPPIVEDEDMITLLHLLKGEIEHLLPNKKWLTFPLHKALESAVA